MRRDQTVEFELEPGPHQVEARINGCRSKALDVLVSSGCTTSLTVQPGNMLLVFTPFPGYIKLARAASPEPSAT